MRGSTIWQRIASVLCETRDQELPVLHNSGTQRIECMCVTKKWLVNFVYLDAAQTDS